MPSYFQTSTLAAVRDPGYGAFLGRPAPAAESLVDVVRAEQRDSHIGKFANPYSAHQAAGAPAAAAHFYVPDAVPRDPAAPGPTDPTSAYLWRGPVPDAPFYPFLNRSVGHGSGPGPGLGPYAHNCPACRQRMYADGRSREDLVFYAVLALLALQLFQLLRR